MPAKTDKTSSECAFVLGDDGLATWSDTHADAWIGLLETHKRLTRSLDAELEAQHGLTISALEALGRLAAAPDRSLRLSALASACGLSLSRISRIMDSLQARGLVERRAVEEDARAVEGHVTDAGLKLVRCAQKAHFESVQRVFFEHPAATEIYTLAAVFSRFAPRAAEACSTPDP